MSNLDDRDFIIDSLKYHTNNKKHICETIRMIYDQVYNLPESESKTIMTELLVDSMQMAKKMQNRLYYYQKTYKDATGQLGSEFVSITGTRSRSKMRHDRYLRDAKHDQKHW
jgi:hypothetical protein